LVETPTHAAFSRDCPRAILPYSIPRQTVHSELKNDVIWVESLFDLLDAWPYRCVSQRRRVCVERNGEGEWVRGVAVGEGREGAVWREKGKSVMVD